MSDTCPTCGSPVVVVGADEGTNHYAPAHTEAKLREALQAIVRDSPDAENWSRGRARVALGIAPEPVQHQ